MPHINKFFLRRLLALGVLGLFLLLGIVGAFRWWLHRLTLPEVAKLASGTRFRVKPVRFISNKEVVFRVSMESYQNPSLLDMDLTKTALLVDETDQAVKPIRWHVKKKNDHMRVGQLVFPVSAHKPKQYILMIFTSEETVFEWML
jgi:hypothetical protein